MTRKDSLPTEPCLRTTQPSDLLRTVDTGGRRAYNPVRSLAANCRSLDFERERIAEKISVRF